MVTQKIDIFPSLETTVEDLYSVVGVFLLCSVSFFKKQIQYRDSIFVLVLELL